MTDMEFEIFDDRFRAILRPDSTLEKLCSGTVWAEGPVYFEEEDCLLWSDIPNNRMLRWSREDGMTVFREPANFTNGHYRDLQGRLISCEHGGRRVTRTEADGSIAVLADNYQGKKLNSPNDLVVKSDGTIWFTDPPYGILSNVEGYQAESEIGANYVYRLDPETGDLNVVADDFDKPNGLAFSPDERTLYISDTGGSHTEGGPHHIRAFDVVHGSRRQPLSDQRPPLRRDQSRPVRRFPHRCERLSLHQRRRRHPRLQRRGRTAGQDPRAGSGGQLHIRRSRQGSPLHRRHHIALRHRSQHPGRPTSIACRRERR